MERGPFGGKKYMSDFAVEDLARRLIRSGAKPRRNTVDWAYFENTLHFELPEDYKSLMDKVMDLS